MTYAIIQWRENSQSVQVGEFGYTVEADPQNNHCYRLLFDSEMEYGFEGLTTEKVSVWMDADTLRPVSLTCRFESMDHVIEMTGEYKNKKVVIRYKEDGISDKWVERIPFQVLDNYQLLFVLRALDFDGMGMNCFSLVNAPTLSIAEVECTCIDREPIVTSIGEFECYRICLQVYDPVPFTQYLLYSLDPPHHLIKVVKGPLVFEVREIT
ncbi:MAG: hypothetical protein JRE28_04230 [Deltaproteobacteria bacterium]|nr:hypothetical protein [Deltaproteobacteria bacterium]